MISVETRARLFVPEAYVAPDPAAIVRAWPFAQLVTTGADGQIHATATPLYFEQDGDDSRLIGHIAARNGQVGTLVEGAAVLALFSGPHAYISSRWYHDLPQVPTWDYLAAQVRGRIEPIADGLAVLERIVAIEEAGAADPWRLEHAPDGRVAKLLPMICAFRIHVDWLDGVTKLNQTHPAADRARIVAALSGQGESHEAAIARLIDALPA